MNAAETNSQRLDREDQRPEAAELLRNCKRDHEALVSLLDGVDSEWGHIDLVYRFYHQSFKAYAIQGITESLVVALRALGPQGRPMNRWFLDIIDEGTGTEFDHAHNSQWLEKTRPMFEAFFHARFMVERAAEAADLGQPPAMLPSGWAALLYLYDLR